MYWSTNSESHQQSQASRPRVSTGTKERACKKCGQVRPSQDFGPRCKNCNICRGIAAPDLGAADKGAHPSATQLAASDAAGTGYVEADAEAGSELARSRPQRKRSAAPSCPGSSSLQIVLEDPAPVTAELKRCAPALDGPIGVSHSTYVSEGLRVANFKAASTELWEKLLQQLDQSAEAGDAVDISIEGLECETFEDFRQQADRADGFLPGLPALLQLEPAPPSEEPTADAAPKQPQPAAQNQELPMGAGEEPSGSTVLQQPRPAAKREGTFQRREPGQGAWPSEAHQQAQVDAQSAAPRPSTGQCATDQLDVVPHAPGAARAETGPGEILESLRKGSPRHLELKRRWKEKTAGKMQAAAPHLLSVQRALRRNTSQHKGFRQTLYWTARNSSEDWAEVEPDVAGAPLIHSTRGAKGEVDQDQMLGLQHSTQSGPTPGFEIAEGPEVPLDETILRIELRPSDKPTKTGQVFLVLATNTLAQLRDKIHCHADISMVSVHGSLAPSSFFYMEGIFYNDWRHPEAQDYSEEIRDFCWRQGVEPPAGAVQSLEHTPVPAAVHEPMGEESLAAHQHQGGLTVHGSTDTLAPHLEISTAGGCLGSRDMATTRFQDLDLRIGPRAGYIFCHQGSCEHLVVVRDIRRIHPLDGGDPRFMGSYPYLTGQDEPAKRNCEICGKKHGVCITHDDMIAPHNPCIWCQECYEMLHFVSEDDDRKVLGASHKVFPYACG
ncbi:hypothetical protein WJX84_011559 [Apatococcus fuscideae]|uniref:snRNA-activating protein complex subunit 3 n=1 Tax=Apatococcus fuscideae TaxID=2026836 RepID=A0AAW1TBY3_9CHLO